MRRNFIFVLAAALLLAPWPIAYGYDTVNAETAGSPIITPADPVAAPQIKAYGHAVGSVTPGDLFEVDMTAIQTDTLFQLIITNVDDLVKDYRFMNLKVGILFQVSESGSWETLNSPSGEESPDIYITMFNGNADFILPGGAKYKIVIETGCFYCYGIEAGDQVASPAFYLTTG